MKKKTYFSLRIFSSCQLYFVISLIFIAKFSHISMIFHHKGFHIDMMFSFVFIFHYCVIDGNNINNNCIKKYIFKHDSTINWMT